MMMHRPLGTVQTGKGNKTKQMVGRLFLHLGSPLIHAVVVEREGNSTTWGSLWLGLAGCLTSRCAMYYSTIRILSTYLSTVL